MVPFWVLLHVAFEAASLCSVLLHICTPHHNAMVAVDTGVLNMIMASHLTLLILYRGPTMKNVVNSIYNPFARRKRPPPVVEQP